jgi:hypothetical protein
MFVTRAGLGFIPLLAAGVRERNTMAERIRTGWVCASAPKLIDFLMGSITPTAILMRLVLDSGVLPTMRKGSCVGGSQPKLAFALFVSEKATFSEIETYTDHEGIRSYLLIAYTSKNFVFI